MFSSAKTNKDKVKQFTMLTQATDRTANKYLKESNWNVEAAIESFYTVNPARAPSGYQRQTSGSASQNSLSSGPVSEKKLNALFDQYKDADEDMILVEGTEQLCNDLELDPTDVATLVLAWHLGCENMCEFNRKGWMKGWSELHCDTIDAMKNVASTFKDELSDPNIEKQIYLYAFQFAKQSTQRSMNLETALAFWDLILGPKYKHIELWKQFLTEKHGKAISKDTWNLFYDFITTVKDDFSEHDDNGAWPVLIDSFVEYAREKQ